MLNLVGGAAQFRALWLIVALVTLHGVVAGQALGASARADRQEVTPVLAFSFAPGSYQWICTEEWQDVGREVLDGARAAAKRAAEATSRAVERWSSISSELERMTFGLASGTDEWGACRYRLIVAAEDGEASIAHMSVWGDFHQESEPSRWEFIKHSAAATLIRKGSRRPGRKVNPDRLYVSAGSIASESEDPVLTHTNKVAEQIAMIMRIGTPTTNRARKVRAWALDVSDISKLMGKLSGRQTFWLPAGFGSGGQAVLLIERELAAGTRMYELTFQVLGGRVLRAVRLSLRRDRLPLEFSESHYVPFSSAIYFKREITLVDSSADVEPIENSYIVNFPYPCVSGEDYRFIEDSAFGFDPSTQGILTQKEFDRLCGESQNRLTDTLARHSAHELRADALDVEATPAVQRSPNIDSPPAVVFAEAGGDGVFSVTLWVGLTAAGVCALWWWRRRSGV